MGTTIVLGRLLTYAVHSAVLQPRVGRLLTSREQHTSESYTQVASKSSAMLEGDVMKTLADRVGRIRFGDGGWHYLRAEKNHKRDVKVHVDLVDVIDRARA